MFRERKTGRGRGRLQFSFRRITLPMLLLRAMVEAVSSTRLSTVLPKVKAALREARHLFLHLISLWMTAVRWYPVRCATMEQPKPLPGSHRSNSLPNLVSFPKPTHSSPLIPLLRISHPPILHRHHPTNQIHPLPNQLNHKPPLHNPLPPTPPPSAQQIPSPILPSPPQIPTIAITPITLHPTPPPSPFSPKITNPKTPQHNVCPITTRLARLILGLDKREQTPSPPPKPIFAALGCFLTQAEAASIERMKNEREQHQQKKAEGTRIGGMASDRHARRRIARREKR